MLSPTEPISSSLPNVHLMRKVMHLGQAKQAKHLSKKANAQQGKISTAREIGAKTDGKPEHPMLPILRKHHIQKWELLVFCSPSSRQKPEEQERCLHLAMNRMEHAIMLQDLKRPEFADLPKDKGGQVFPRHPEICFGVRRRDDLQADKDFEPFINTFDWTLQREPDGFEDDEELRDLWAELTFDEKRDLLLWTAFRRSPNVYRSRPVSSLPSVPVLWEKGEGEHGYWQARKDDVKNLYISNGGKALTGMTEFFFNEAETFGGAESIETMQDVEVQ